MPARSARTLAKIMPDDAFFPDSVVSWDEITRAEATAYERALADARVEEDMQRFLEAHPRMLAQQLNGERLAWVMPRRRLGSEYVTDFLIAQRAAGRYSWCAVELERPQARMFTRNGDPSHVLTHALRQIADWRTWLARNLGYASQTPERSGLGLVDIEPDLDGMVIIGRDSEVPPGAADLRRTICRSYNVRIETYDWLLSAARDRLEVLERAESRRPGADLLAWLCKPRPEEPARSAVGEVFNGIFSTYSRVSALREVDWEGVVLDPDHPDVTAALRIVPQPGRPTDEILQSADWADWTDFVERDTDTDLSLLVTESRPSDSLLDTLSPVGEGVWCASRIPGWLPTDLLVHMPATASGETRKGRLRAARTVLLRHIPAQPAEDDEDDPDIEVLLLIAGDSVVHAKFGLGTVQSTMGSGSKSEAIVDFGEEFGTRHLVLRYAPLEKLSEPAAQDADAG
jgi:hypothetical protein